LRGPFPSRERILVHGQADEGGQRAANGRTKGRWRRALLESASEGKSRKNAILFWPDVYALRDRRERERGVIVTSSPATDMFGREDQRQRRASSDSAAPVLKRLLTADRICEEEDMAAVDLDLLVGPLLSLVPPPSSKAQQQAEEAILTELVGLIDFDKSVVVDDDHQLTTCITSSSLSPSSSSSSGCPSLAASGVWSEDDDSCGASVEDHVVLAAVDLNCAGESFNESILFADEGFAEETMEGQMDEGHGGEAKCTSEVEQPLPFQRDLATKMFLCPHCPKTFRYSSRLQRHLTSHDERKRFACEDCGKLFSRPDVVATHRAKIHGQRRQAAEETAKASSTRSEDEGLRCPLGCGAVSSSRHHLERHLRAHAARASDETCPHCQKVLRGRRALRRHLRSVHGEGGGKSFSCAQCGAKFGQRQLLARHERTHSGELPFECRDCGRRFNQAGNLRQHRARMHADQSSPRPHRCPQCPKSFHSAAELRNHAAYHAGLRQHVCGQCGAAFFERRHLERHARRVHAGGVRKFFCSDCGRTFVERYELNFHKKKCASLMKASL